jgi:hypothetical protein
MNKFKKSRDLSRFWRQGLERRFGINQWFWSSWKNDPLADEERASTSFGLPNLQLKKTGFPESVMQPKSVQNNKDYHKGRARYGLVVLNNMWRTNVSFTCCS